MNLKAIKQIKVWLDSHLYTYGRSASRTDSRLLFF